MARGVFFAEKLPFFRQVRKDRNIPFARAGDEKKTCFAYDRARGAAGLYNRPRPGITPRPAPIHPPVHPPGGIGSLLPSPPP